MNNHPGFKRNPGQQRARDLLLTKDKRFCLIYGGSRSGKTFELVGTVVERALYAPGSNHLIVRQEAISAKKSIVNDTLPKVMGIRWPGLRWRYDKELSVIILANESRIWIGGINDANAMERLLGMEYSTIYMNETSEMSYAAFGLLRTRLAAQSLTINGKVLSQRFYVDLNPTVQQHWTYMVWHKNIDPESNLFIDGTQFGYITISPEDNAENLSAEYLDDLRSQGPERRRRFYEGVYGADDPGAIWRRSMIHRVPEAPEMSRIVVAIDPAMSTEAGSNETGIVVAGLGFDGNGYLLEDCSGAYRAEDWARVGISAFDGWSADLIVGEKNQGGELVEMNMRTVRQNIPFHKVWASRGKVARAEPISTLYERRRIFHVGEFPQLEDQMCAFKPDMDRKRLGYSPDRVDAMVWAFAELFPGMTNRKRDAVKTILRPIYSPFS